MRYTCRYEITVLHCVKKIKLAFLLWDMLTNLTTLSVCSNEVPFAFTTPKIRITGLLRLNSRKAKERQLVKLSCFVSLLQ